jgi:hypothetical protein
MSEDLKKALLWASVAGIAFTGALYAIDFQNEGEESHLSCLVEEFEKHKGRAELQKDIISELT